MEEKSTPDMISMSRPSRDNRASKNPKVTADTANIPSSKKSQICTSGTSPRATRASKKAKTGGVETLAGASKATKKPESGSERSDTRSLNLTSGVVSRSKRAAENGGDVTLDALRPAKKQKISEDNGASTSPLLSPGHAKSLKSEGENGKHIPATPSTTTGEASPDSPLGNLESGVGSADITITGQPAEEIKGGSEYQIGSRATRRANGLSGAGEKLKEEQRALRPRPRPTARKVKKRTRFHEVTLAEGDGPRIVGRRIKVFWPLEERYFYGHVKAFNGSKKLQHKIVYDDKDEEWVRLQNEKFGIELEPGEVFGGPALAPATETSTGAKGYELDNSNELTGDAPTAVDDGETDIKAVEGTTTGKGRIKPEGVYRRKRKEERTNEENTQRSDGAIEREKRGEGERIAKKKGEGNGESKKKEKGDGKDKNTEKGDGEDKKSKGDSDPKNKTEGASEPKKKLEGKQSVRKKGEANNKQRGALADRLGRVNAKRSSGKSFLRERRKKGVLVVTSRDRMRKIVSVDGSSGRRKKAGKEKVRSESSVQIRTRLSNLADQEGQKTLRSRIRDDDRLFPSVKPPNAVTKGKAPESKRSREPKTLRSSSEAKHFGQAKISQKIASEDEKLVSSFTVNVRERKGTEDLPSTGQEAKALGPFEAVMDAYREALSDTKDVPSSLAIHSPEDHSSEAVREDEKASVKTDCMGDQDDDGREVAGEDLDEASRVTTRALPGPPVTGAIESAVPTETQQFQEDSQQAGIDLLAGGELNNDGQRMSADLSTSEVVDGEAVESITSASSVGPFTPLARDECRTGREVGAYYGGPTLESFIKVTKHENYRMNVRSPSSTLARDCADSVDLRSFLRAGFEKNSQPSRSSMGERLVTNEIQLISASDGGAATDSGSRGELITRDLPEANGQDIVHDLHQTRAHVPSVDICRSDDSDPHSLEGFVHANRRSRGHDIPFMGRTSCLCQDSPSFVPDDIMQLPSEGHLTSCIPFRGPWFIDAFKSKDFLLHVTIPRYFGAIPRSLFIQESSSSTCSLSLLSRNIFCLSYRSTLDEIESARPQDLGTNVLQVGTHLGPPSVVSMLRVSREFWSRLLAVQRKVQQPIKFVSASSPTIEEKGVRTDPQPQSSIETVDDDEVSDQEFRAQENSGAGSGLDPSVVGDDFSSIKPTGRSFGPMKKGRRTGKGLKRSLLQNVGEAVGRDGSGVDRFAQEDLVSGRPYSKRTRVEIESCGAAIPRDNGLETSPVYSDLEGKGFTATSVSTHEKAKDSRLPRMNVLKLRRCPTNKGVWLVAGNSCGPSQDTGLRGPSAEAEQKVPFNSRDQGVGVDPMTPVFETSRKRVLHQSLESSAPGSTDLNRNPPAATVSSTDSQELEMSGPGVRPTNAGSPDIWFDCGIASVNGGVADGPETRKRRRKGHSPNTGDDVDVISEHSLRRSADHNWGSCTANVLITKSDRCVRETGAVVELQLRHGNTYMLTVSLHGESQYALKTDQPVPSGTTNKFTHSMMWRGGKAWSLEFVDRKQWQLFKDLHEECFQRNARAASVRHIPIPGVKQIQECPKSGPRYVRPSHKYIRQYDGETEVAFSSTRVVYDMDSEDEEWLNQVNSEKVGARGTRSRAKVDEDTLERVIDKLEKTSYIQQQDAMSADTAAELCQALGSQEAIKAIHSYWSEKRQRKGMALVRLFQPAPWEQYQKQLQEWQEKINQLQQQLPTATKQQLQASCKRPPLFAFCLRPRGLETKNKMQRQRSHRKQGLSSSSSRQWTVPGPTSDFYFDSPSKRQPSVDSTGGPFNGSRKFLRQHTQEGGFSDPMAVDLTESFNAIAGEGFTSVEHAGQAISEGTPVFSRAESGSIQQFETSTTGGFSKRTKKLGRKAKKMKLLAAAEESRRKRLRRAQQGLVNGRFAEMGQSPGSLSDFSGFPPVTDPSTSGVTLHHTVGQDDDKVAIALAAEAFAKAKRETAVTLRSRAQALHAIADAAMHKAVAAVVAADAIHAAERANEDASERGKAQPAGNHRQQRGDVPAGVKDDPSRPWGRSDASGGPSFGSWRRALNSASKNANHILSKGSSSKPGMMSDVDDALLPVASWSQELGAGLGTRLLQTGEVSPRQKYSPVEGVSKSPARVRGEGLVSLGRTRGESMMAMLTR